MQTARRIIACCFEGQGKTNYINFTSIPLLALFSIVLKSKNYVSPFFYLLVTSKMLGRVPSGEK